MGWDEAHDILGVAPGAGSDAVRRAYARQLRRTNPEDDPEGFKRLRAARDLVMAHAEAWTEATPPFEPAPEAPAAETHRADAPAPPPVSLPPVAAPPVAAPPPADIFDTPAPPLPQSVPEPAPESESAALRRAILAELIDREERFEAALAQPAGPSADIAGSFRAILHHESLDWQVTSQIEEWAIALILRVERSVRDVLAPIAIDRFDWDRGERGWIDDDRVAAILQLDETRRYVASLAGSPLREAFAVLVRPHGRFERRRIGLSPRARGIARLVGPDLDRLPDLADYLDPGEVAYWRGVFARPHLRGLAFALGAGGTVATLIGMIWQVGENRPIGFGLTALLLLSLLLPWVDKLAVQRPNRRWRAATAPHPAWQRIGWLPFGAVAALSTIAMPATDAGLILQSIACLLTIWWVLVTADPPRGLLAQIPRQRTDLLALIGVAAFVLPFTLATTSFATLIGVTGMAAAMRTSGRERLYLLLVDRYRTSERAAAQIELAGYLVWIMLALVLMRLSAPLQPGRATFLVIVGYLVFRGTARDLEPGRRGGRAIMLAVIAVIAWTAIMLTMPVR